MSVSIILVEKNTTLKTLTVKDFKESELFKKCGFKKSEDFKKHTQWNLKHKGDIYEISVYGKTIGRVNNENKYEFPPPIDNMLFFGSCCIIAKKLGKVESLSLELWEKFYEKLFGGFEDLALTSMADEEDEDELACISKDKKTKQGYLKDGFIVDSDEEEEEDDTENDSESEEITKKKDDNDTEDSDEFKAGSELSEDSYEV